MAKGKKGFKNAPTYDTPEETKDTEIKQNVATQDDLTEENTAPATEGAEAGPNIEEPQIEEPEMTENQKNKKFWDELFNKDEEELSDADKQMKAKLESLYTDLTTTFADQYKNVGDTPDGKTQTLVSQEDFNSWYGDYYKALAVKHANGGYDPVDYTKANIERQRDSVKEVVDADPSMKEACAAYDARAIHVRNTLDAVHKQGDCTFSSCMFKDKDGNPVELNWDEEHYEQSLQAVQYGLDHNLIDCTLPNGQKFEVPTKDGYIDNLDYYDSMADKADEFRVRIAEKAAEKGVDVPDYVKDKDAFIADANKENQDTIKKYSEFQNGGRLEILKQAGLQAGVEKVGEAQHAANQAAISQTMSKGEKYIEGKPQLALEEKNPVPAYTGNNPAIKAAMAKADEASDKTPETEMQIQ